MNWSQSIERYKPPVAFSDRSPMNQAGVDGQQLINPITQINREEQAILGNIAVAAKNASDTNDLVNLERLLRTALLFIPDNDVNWQSYGVTLCKLGKLDTGLKCAGKAALIQKYNNFYYYNLGVLAADGQRFLEALLRYKTSIIVDPSYTLSNNNYGCSLQGFDIIKEAEICYRRVIAIEPDHPGARHNLSMVVLAQGDFENGWAMYEWRWKTPILKRVDRDFKKPRWKKELGNGRTVLIIGEQGCGDTLQFCRYVPLIAAMGWRIEIEVQPQLLRMLQGLPGVSRLFLMGDPLPKFDAVINMMSIPLAFGTKLDNIPASQSYLQAEPYKVSAWMRRLAILYGDAPRIGLVWSGDPRPDIPDCAATDRRRSMSPDFLVPLFPNKKVYFFSLQKGGSETAKRFGMIDFMEDMRDFADTAALIANLDLVISVDTAVAHLAGALGKPVWLMDRLDACWRWLRGRDDSPWYPTLKIFRQTSQGEWAGVIERIKLAIEDRFFPHTGG